MKTYKYIILEDISNWGAAGMTIEDGMFLACDSRVQQNVVSRKNLSSAVLGGEGLVNVYRGTGRTLYLVILAIPQYTHPHTQPIPVASATAFSPM